MTEFYHIFNQKPTASDILNLIEKTKAHQGNLTTLTDLLTVIYIVNHDKNLNQQIIQEFLKNTIEIYKTININDIDKNLTGKEIGLALTALRVDKIQKLIDDMFG